MQFDDVLLDFLGHSGFALTTPSGLKIVIDPYNLSAKPLKADVVLLTHSHYDHCSIKDIEKILKPGATIIMTADCQSKVTRLKDVTMHVVEVGDHIEVGGVKIEVVSAYNKESDFHPKSEGWAGYVIKVGKVIVYHAGDSDFIPEMHRLSGHGKRGQHFVGLLPVSGSSVMDAEEAAQAASLISPDTVIPMHYGAGVAGSLEDAQRFVELCTEKGLHATILEKV